jgi:PAS domain-containing protein
VTPWVLGSFAAAALLAIALVFWRKWILPWTAVNQLIGDIRRGRRPRTYLIPGADRPRQIALALEAVFERQFQLDQQLSERASGTETIVTAMQEGLLVVDTNQRIQLANRAFRELFLLPDPVPRAPLLEVLRHPEIDRLTKQILETGQPHRQQLTITGQPNEGPRFM